MEKLISLAQVEQLIDEMQEECLQLKPWEWGLSKRDALQDLRNKLSSLPTEESGWIAVKDIEMLQRYNHWYEYDVTDMVESDTWEYVRYESLKLLPKSPLQ